MVFSTRTSPFSYDSVSQAWKPSTEIPASPSLAVDKIFRIITWNIDFMEPFQPERVTAAIAYLEAFLQDKLEPTIVLLQEIMSSSLDTLLASSWLKEKFQISHMQPEQYSAYFTITLVPRDIGVVTVFRTPLVRTHMGRDGLFVDLLVSHSPTADRNITSILRVCNTHLESLQSGNSIRPLQLSQIASLLQTTFSPDMEIVAGLVGGDMNAISPNDEDLHHRPEIGLEDVYEIAKGDKALLDDTNGGLGGGEGYTWGYQPICQYPPGRLDKIMFTGTLRPTAVGGRPCVTRLGVGLKVKVRDVGLGSWGSSDGETEETEETEVWVTDHFGIAATFMVLGRTKEMV